MSMESLPHISPTEEPLPKRRKVAPVIPVRTTTHHVEIRPDGTMTPLHDIPQPLAGPSDANHAMNDAMDSKMSPSDCPCGYLHGPGEHHFHDISAVGLSSSMMRGPD